MTRTQASVAMTTTTRSSSLDSSIRPVAMKDSKLERQTTMEELERLYDEPPSKNEEPSSNETADVAKYVAKRRMTPWQERMNAITILPNVVYCLYYLQTRAWIQDTTDNDMLEATPPAWLNATTACGPHHTPVPPWGVLCVVLGICVHAPFSFWYHWHCARTAVEQHRHWTRRMDQSMIHVASILFSMALSNRPAVWWINLVLNVDCIYRQWLPQHRPFSNQIRILASFIGYTLTMAFYNAPLFLQYWMVSLVAIWFFSLYPIGGWSHSVFHLIMMAIPPILMQAVLELPHSQPALQWASHCLASIQS